MLANLKHRNGPTPHLVGEVMVLLLQKELGSVSDKVGGSRAEEASLASGSCAHSCTINGEMCDSCHCVAFYVP